MQQKNPAVSSSCHYEHTQQSALITTQQPRRTPIQIPIATIGLNISSFSPSALPHESSLPICSSHPFLQQPVQIPSFNPSFPSAQMPPSPQHTASQKLPISEEAQNQIEGLPQMEVEQRFRLQVRNNIHKNSSELLQQIYQLLQQAQVQPEVQPQKCIQQCQQKQLQNEEQGTQKLTHLSRKDSFKSQKSQLQASSIPKFKCKCKKTRCLKMYCQCFAEGRLCSGCMCTDCQNLLQFQQIRANAIDQALQRDPDVFQTRAATVAMYKMINSNPIDADNNKNQAISKQLQSQIQLSKSKSRKGGCICKKTECLKKYCECYSSGLACSEECKCQNCCNTLQYYRYGNTATVTSNINSSRNSYKIVSNTVKFSINNSIQDESQQVNKMENNFPAQN